MIVRDSRWRPPLPPEAPRAGEVSVKVSPPEHGWMQFNVLSDGKDIEFAPSYVFFGLKSLKEWLELAAQGEAPCIYMDAEGWGIYLILSPLETPDMVRFTVAFLYFGAPIPESSITRWQMPNWDGKDHFDVNIEWMCDVACSQRHVVEVFYKGLIEIWEKPDKVKFWYMWNLIELDDFDPEFGEKDPREFMFDIASKTIDEYLSNSAT